MAEERNIQEDEIDLIELVKTIWVGRKFIAKVAGIFIIIGLVIAFVSEEEYDSSSSIILESSGSSEIGGAGSLLKQYGGLLGLSGVAGGAEIGINPMLYPRIVNSIPFKREILNFKIYIPTYDTTVTIYDFFAVVRPKPLSRYVIEYTVKLPYTLKKMFKKKNLVQSDQINTSGLTIYSKEEEIVLDQLEGRIIVFVEDETGILKINTKFPDPYGAAILNKLVLKLLSERVEKYKSEKLNMTEIFIEEQLVKSEKKFASIQKKLARFQDRNVNINSAYVQIELKRLESEYELAFAIHKNFAEQIEQLKIKKEENKPIFSVLNPPAIPIERTWPRRGLILIISSILGTLSSITFIFLKLHYKLFLS